MEERLDKILLQRGLVKSRVRAEEIIRTHGVLVNKKMIHKTGKKFPLDVIIELLVEDMPYVSRGALKLKKAFESFEIVVDGMICLDIGASTGGFTEILLENGAKKVYALDVGTAQLHATIKENDKVVNLEKTHIREINQKMIPDQIDTVVVDVSFISLEKIFPFFHPYLKIGGNCIALIKPQFEVGKENVGKGGIVKKKALYSVVIDKIRQNALINNLEYKQHIESPILGGDGNREFLMWFQKIGETNRLSL
jgi:23S rRNA (cytidine1920-2'-O)/16S rRNA (cytidine1409-2'-O)-methyltransferase